MNTNSDFVTKMKYNIKTTFKILDREGITNHQSRWELLQNEIRKCLIEFSKKIAKNANKEILVLAKSFKMLEITTKYDKNPEYIDCKNKRLKKLII